jgi:hypothetical protein
MGNPDLIPAARKALESYRRVRDDVDRWFERVVRRNRAAVVCGRGCSMCCHGLFDIGVPDALALTAAFGDLPADQRQPVIERARKLQIRLDEAVGVPDHPYLLDSPDDARVGRAVELFSGAPCPLLGDDGACLVYRGRPLPCRVEGLPLVDTRDGRFGDWCELNFTSGTTADMLDQLSFDWNSVTDAEDNAAQAVAEAAGIPPRSVMFIPSLLMAYETFWKPVLEGLRGNTPGEEPAQAGGSTTTSS